MQAKFTQELDFRRERDFGAKVNATFEFLGAHFRPLLKCLAYFVLPGTLLFGIGMGLFMGNVLQMMPTPGVASPVPPNLQAFGLSSLAGVGLTAVGALVAFLLLSSTVYGFVRVRMDTPATEEVQPAQVWAYIRPRLGRVLRAWLLLGGLSLVLMAISMGGGLAMIRAASTSGGSATVLTIGMLLVFAFFFSFTWVMVVLTLYFPALLVEDIGVWAALRRSFYLVRGKWWSSFGLFVVMGIIQSFMGYLFAIPMYGVMMAKLLKVPGLDSPIISVVTASIYAVGVIFTYAIPLLAMSFQYFNLVERRDGFGLRLLVEGLGQAPAPSVSAGHYRPEEDGEY